MSRLSPGDSRHTEAAMFLRPPPIWNHLFGSWSVFKVIPGIPANNNWKHRGNWIRMMRSQRMGIQFSHILRHSGLNFPSTKVGNLGPIWDEISSKNPKLAAAFHSWVSQLMIGLNCELFHVIPTNSCTQNMNCGPPAAFPAVGNSRTVSWFHVPKPLFYTLLRICRCSGGSSVINPPSELTEEAVDARCISKTWPLRDRVCWMRPWRGSVGPKCSKGGYIITIL